MRRDLGVKELVAPTNIRCLMSRSLALMVSLGVMQPVFLGISSGVGCRKVAAGEGVWITMASDLREPIQ